MHTCTHLCTHTRETTGIFHRSHQTRHTRFVSQPTMPPVSIMCVRVPHSHVQTCAWEHIRTHARTHARMHARIHARTPLTYACTHACTHTGSGLARTTLPKRTPCLPPTAVTELAVGEVRSRRVGLSWSVPADDGGAPIERYRVEQRLLKQAWAFPGGIVTPWQVVAAIDCTHLLTCLYTFLYPSLHVHTVHINVDIHIYTQVYTHECTLV